MLPSRKQFNSWSLPTKWGFLTAVITLVTFVFVLIGYAFGLFNWFTLRIHNESEQPILGKSLPSKSVTKEENEILRPVVKDKVHKNTIESAITPLLDSIELIYKEKKQFDYLNGNEPRNNYSVFLKKYYGLGSNPALGDPLIESLLGFEIEWSVKVSNVITDEKNSYVIFEVNDPVCIKVQCPNKFSDKSFAEFSSVNGIPSIVRKGDFIHIRGILKEFSAQIENPNGSLRDRMHVHPIKITYSASNNNDLKQ